MNIIDSTLRELSNDYSPKEKLDSIQKSIDFLDSRIESTRNFADVQINKLIALLSCITDQGNNIGQSLYTNVLSQEEINICKIVKLSDTEINNLSLEIDALFWELDNLTYDGDVSGLDDRVYDNIESWKRYISKINSVTEGSSFSKIYPNPCSSYVNFSINKKLLLKSFSEVIDIEVSNPRYEDSFKDLIDRKYQIPFDITKLSSQDIFLFDSLGRNIGTFTLNQSNFSNDIPSPYVTTTIETNSLPNGIYFLKTLIGNKIVTNTFVKTY